MRDDWQTVKLGEVAEITAGQSPKGSNYNTAGEGMPFYQGKKEFRDKFIGEPKYWTTQITRTAIEGDVLMSVRAPVGPVNFATREICIGRGLAAIRNGSKLSRNYLFYYLLFKRDEIEGNDGAVFPSINKKQIGEIDLVLPPFPEQERIVAILDKVFSGIDQAITHTEQNLASARELFESYLNNIFTQRGEGWVEKKLGVECTIMMGQSPKGDSYNNDGVGVPLINGPVEFGGLDPFAETQAIKFTTSPTKICKKGDVILCVRGSTTGRMNIAGHDACIGRGVAAIRSENNHQWVKQFISFSRATVYRLGSGSTFPNVSSKQLAQIVIPIPPESRRDDLVDNVVKMKQQVHQLEALYTQKLEFLKELKQSLLQQAFAGELTSAKLSTGTSTQPSARTKEATA